MNKQSGFSLIEVLIASVLLFGLIYICLSSMQSQSSHTDSTINGKYLSVLMNNMIVDIAKNNSRCPVTGTADVAQILNCYPIHTDVQARLKKMGFDLTSSHSLVDLHKTNVLQITLASGVKLIDSHTLYDLGNIVLANLSHSTMNCLAADRDVPFANQTGSTANLILQFNLKPGCGA